jgi:hypothetical protein
MAHPIDKRLSGLGMWREGDAREEHGDPMGILHWRIGLIRCHMDMSLWLWATGKPCGCYPR